MERKNKIRLYSFILASVIGMTSLSGCKENKEEDNAPEKYIISKDNDSYHYDNFVNYKIENGKAVCYYKGENICLTINKETSEITEYICEYGSFLWEETLDAYEIPSGNMIIAKDTIGGKTIDYYNYIKETCDIISFIDISNYIEGATCKEWYTLDEIKELEPLILDSYLKITELQKELSKTK